MPNFGQCMTITRCTHAVLVRQTRWQQARATVLSFPCEDYDPLKKVTQFGSSFVYTTRFSCPFENASRERWAICCFCEQRQTGRTIHKRTHNLRICVQKRIMRR